MKPSNQSLSNTIKLIKSQLPEFDKITRDIRKSGGYLSLPDQVIDLLSIDGLPPWSSYYDDPLKLKTLASKVLIGPRKLKKFNKRIKKLNKDEQAKIRESFKTQILDSDVIDLGFDKVKIPSEADFDQWLDEAINTKNTDNQASLYLMLYTMLTQIFFYLAVMTFGRSMTSLVQAAQKGDEGAFFAAVRIDKTVLFGVPYFRQRLLKAQISSEPQFLQKLANAIKGTSLGSKLSYRRLMFVFVLLDDEGFLDLPLNQLLEICIEVGIIGIDDPELLGKRRKYYKDNAGRQIQF